jgi:hypothetical protein
MPVASSVTLVNLPGAAEAGAKDLAIMALIDRRYLAGPYYGRAPDVACQPFLFMAGARDPDMHDTAPLIISSDERRS